MWKLAQRILKIEPGVSLGQWTLDRITNNWAALVGLVGGAAMTYLAAISAWLRPYAPVSWGLVGLISAFLIVVVLWLIAKIRTQFIMGTISKSFVNAEKHVNPKQETFQGQRINLNDLILPFHRIINGKTFIDCEIVGPGNLALSPRLPRGSMTACRFIGSNGVIVKYGSQVPFTILLENCAFLRCDMLGLLMFMTEDQRDFFASALTEDFWLTPKALPMSSLPVPEPPAQQVGT
jgi:hypothetical protein